MLRLSQLTKCATVAMTIAALATGTASARPADAPSRAHRVARHTATVSWTQPRIDSPGIRPATQNSRPAPPVPLVVPVREAGFDWLSAVIGASALLAVTLLLLIGRSIRSPHRGRIAPPSV
jgi:hypothetical protein